MIKRLKNHGASVENLIDVYIKQIRSILELAVPVWHSSLTLINKMDIERVQKATLHVILGEDYTSYSAACELTNLVTLDERRIKLCKTFALRTLKNIKHKQWFKINTTVSRTIFKQPIFYAVLATIKRLQKSPISYSNTKHGQDQVEPKRMNTLYSA